jgi:hypothetical protein
MSADNNRDKAKVVSFRFFAGETATGKHFEWRDYVEKSAYDAVIEELRAAKIALEFYGNKDRWSEFISTGNVFDGDAKFLEVFEAGPDGTDGGSIARAAIAKIDKVLSGGK